MNEQYPQNFGTIGQPYTGLSNAGTMIPQTPNWNMPTGQVAYYPQPQQTSRPTQSITSGMPGRVVNSQDEIMPQEVPMNGMVSIFPKADFSEIYAKCWNSNGTIDTKVYIFKPLDEQTPATETSGDTLNEILRRLDIIERNTAYKPHYNKSRYDKPKEVKNND